MELLIGHTLLRVEEAEKGVNAVEEMFKKERAAGALWNLAINTDCKRAIEATHEGVNLRAYLMRCASHKSCEAREPPVNWGACIRTLASSGAVADITRGQMNHPALALMVHGTASRRGYLRKLQDASAVASVSASLQLRVAIITVGQPRTVAHPAAVVNDHRPP